MKTRYAIRLTLILIFLCCPLCITNAQAETSYVSDRLIVSLRTEVNGGKAIATLRSDDPVEIIEKSGRNVRIVTRDGKTGWIKAQYITEKIPDHFVVDGLKKEINRLNKTIEDMHKEKGPLGEQLKKLQTEYKTKSKEYENRLAGQRSEKNALAEQLELSRISFKELQEKSTRAIQAVEQYDKILSEKNQLMTEAAHLKVENTKLKNTANLFWFMAGAGVFLVGWIIGKISRRKSHSSLSM